MNILILGSGGREHALAWAVRQNPKCDALYCAPGNAGIADVATCVALNPEASGEIISFCQENKIEFVIIGAEAPLALGVADDLRAASILTFGPSAAAARLEASKAFTKQICDACNAPTSAYGWFNNAADAKAHIRKNGAPIVVKADGLAAGKGVIVAMDEETALAAIDDMFDGSFGEAGAEVVIEEFMEGEEASFFVLSDGTSVLPIGTAQDHKRAFDGDQGPNTGGMGAYSPAPVLTQALQEKTLREIVQPTIDEMAKRGTPYEGVLYVGLMIKNDQPRLVEYNVRFGDPECQVLMMRLGAQALDALLACANQDLANFKLHWADDHAMTVVMAANGYPGSYEKGTKIGGLNKINNSTDLHVFHAGTAKDGDNIIAIGGRVLNITARGNTLAEARKNAYAQIKKLDWPNGFCRSDIGWRAL